MTTEVLLEGFDRETDSRVAVLSASAKYFRGYGFSRRPRNLTVREVDAIIRTHRFSGRRLKRLRYTVRLVDTPKAAVWERFYCITGFPPEGEGDIAFLVITDDEHILDFSFIRKVAHWTKRSFPVGEHRLKPEAAKAILEKFGFEPVKGAIYDIGEVMHYPPLGPRKDFSIEVRPRGRKHFRNYLTMGLDKLSLRKVDAILGMRKRGRREIVDITAQQVDELCSDFGYREDVNPKWEYRISRRRNGKCILW